MPEVVASRCALSHLRVVGGLGGCARPWREVASRQCAATSLCELSAAPEGVASGCALPRLRVVGGRLGGWLVLSLSCALVPRAATYRCAWGGGEVGDLCGN